jgi:hypothetical protein
MKPKRYGENPERCMNKILAALSAPSRDWTQNLEPVKLAVGTVLYEPDETTGMKNSGGIRSCAIYC